MFQKSSLQSHNFNRFGNTDTASLSIAKSQSRRVAVAQNHSVSRLSVYFYASRA